MILKKLKAISYVEIILVLTIVGVISSISIPSMKRHSQKSEFGVLAKKSYLSLNEAVDNSILTHGPMRNWFDSQGSLKNIWINVVRPSFASVGGSGVTLLTKDKLFYRLENPNAADSKEMEIFVDLNTTNVGPNTSGKDQHYLIIDLDKESVYPKVGSDTETLSKNNWVYTNELWYK